MLGGQGVRNDEVADLVGATTWAPDADEVVATIGRLAAERRRARVAARAAAPPVSAAEITGSDLRCSVWTLRAGRRPDRQHPRVRRPAPRGVAAPWPKDVSEIDALAAAAADPRGHGHGRRARRPATRR